MHRWSRRGYRIALGWTKVCSVEWEPEGKGRPSPQLALNDDISAEKAREASRDGQSKPCSPAHRVTTRPGTNLLEFIEDSRLISLGNADPSIDNLDCNPGAIGGRGRQLYGLSIRSQAR